MKYYKSKRNQYWIFICDKVKNKYIYITSSKNPNHDLFNKKFCDINKTIHWRKLQENQTFKDIACNEYIIEMSKEELFLELL